MNEEVKRPKNLQSLLNFCIKADDGGSLKNDIDPVEASRKNEWLKKVMAETYVNFGERTKEDILILYQVIENNTLFENSIPALEELQDITENIEYAKDFIKMGGLELIKNLLNLSFKEILMESAQLLGITIQNDEVCQLAAINAGFVEFLLNKIEISDDANVAKKLVFALSCCIRGHTRGLEIFRDSNGTKILLDCMNKGLGESSPKCAFLLHCLVNDCNNIELVLSESEFVKLMNKIVELPLITDSAMEYLMGVVSKASQQNSSYKNKINDQFISWLVLKSAEIKDREEHEELINHINEILRCFKTK